MNGGRLTARAAAAGPDSPADVYRAAPRQAVVAVVAGIAIVTVAAWVITVRWAESMADMVMGLGQVGAMSMGMSVGAFLAMWSVMMVAMMAPTIAPVLVARRSVALVAGYFAVWCGLGIVAYLAFLWIVEIPPDASGSRWLAVVAGAILALAGAYQFTREKARRLEACCHPGAASAAPAFRAGWSHGLDCLGCCGPAMLVLVVVGFMNLAWMLGLSLLFVAEKHSVRALVVSRVAGGALVVLGVAVMVHPPLLPTLAGISS